MLFRDFWESGEEIDFNDDGFEDLLVEEADSKVGRIRSQLGVYLRKRSTAS